MHTWLYLNDSMPRFLNSEHIYPTRRRPVKVLIDNLTSSDPGIQKIYIFGSSVTGACKPWSDIDVWVEGWDSSIPHVTPMVEINEDYGDFEFDIWGTKHPPELWQSVLSEGVLVYDKDLD